ncbi:MAG: hypothetical protein JO202_09300 [Ktedonobacteraceae bacterium]|nr:hypothetical protein [Ktedonobacteraceae bacterium]
MLNYTETTTISTIVSVMPLSPSQCRPLVTDHASSVVSYAIGPINPTQITTLHAHLSTGDECSLFIPTQIPSSMLTHPVFKEGYEWGYLESHAEEEEWSVPKLVNELYQNLADLWRSKQDPDFYPWTLGFLLGELANIVEWDKPLALTGLAHFCFLLPLFTQEHPVDWPRYEPYHPAYLHDHAVKAYRARVRCYREQGKSYDEAQRLALHVDM